MLYKRGKVWWIRIKQNRKEIRRSTKTGNKDIAKKIELKILNQIAEGNWFEKDLAATTLFRDLWEKFMREESKFKAQSTHQRAIQCAKNFLPEFGDLTLSQITPAVLSSYKVKRLESGVKLSTAVKELQFVRRVFSLSKREWQFVKQSPFEFFKMPNPEDHRVRFLEEGQFEQLLLACSLWLKPMVILARYTGMRRGNILNLTWSQIDLQKGLIHLDYTKNGQRITLPLTETPYAVLSSLRENKVRLLACPFVFHRDGVPYSPYQVSMAFKRACKRAKIDNFRFHDLRHDFASNLVQNGNDLYVVQHLLGHKDGRMTQRYAHLRIDDLRNAVETLEAGHKKWHSGEKEKGLLIVTP